MQKYLKLILAIVLLIQIQACKTNERQLIAIEEVSPWCILGFDSEERTPQERISMLKELGLKKYGYNRGKGTFDIMKEEFSLASANDIKITSVFVWLNAKRDSLGKLSASNKQLLSNLKETEQKPAVWVSFSNNYFENKSNEESIELAVEMIKYIKTLTDKLGSELALYNHRGWFGNPLNQINILDKLNEDSITMVYNFHHAHDYVQDFESIAKKITPHLSYVNLNGVKKEGPEILSIGEGDHEHEMIKCLIKEGYKGPWGILGHIKTENVRIVLQRNIDGLRSLNALDNRK